MEKLPKGIILAAHKPIASAMLKAATQIMGPIDHCAAADIDSDAGEKEPSAGAATAGRAGDTSIPSATPRISPLLAFMPTKAANAMTKMGMMILNICCLHSEMPKRIMPLRRQASRLFPNAT